MQETPGSKYSVRPVIAAAAGILGAIVPAILLVVVVAFQFDGTCGGWLPFLAAPRPCSFSDYMGSAVPFALQVAWHDFWFVFLASSAAGVITVLLKSK